MLDISYVLATVLMKTYTDGEFEISEEMEKESRCMPLIANSKNGTVKVRTQEYNEKCIDKW